MKPISFLLINTFSLIFALVMNGLAGSSVFGNTSVGDVSARYETLFTPAGYAFAIWGIIYLLLILFVGYQWFARFRRNETRELRQTGLWFALGNLANGLWIFAWLNEKMGISLLLLFILLFSLIVLTARLRLETWDAPVKIIFFVWWPLAIYLGWIIVATTANFSVFLVSINWNGGFLSEKTWAIVLIVVAAGIYLLLVALRNLRETALVGVWALVAIAVKQWGVNGEIVFTALAASFILLTGVSIHGFKNRKTSPFVKLRQ